MNGLILIDKPAGMSSHGVVGRVRRIAGIKKVGHTGTLDPFATGVLPICLGRATRLAGFLTLEDKEYEATVRLGVATDTMDLEGEVLSETPVPELSLERIESVLETFRGPVRQLPPMYSALKHQGKALYKYAREGKEVERKPREVTIHRLELVECSLPELRIKVACSKGTYIRVLASDIGEALGVGAHLIALRRTSTGPFRIDRANSLEVFANAVEAGSLEELVIPPLEILPAYPRVEVKPGLAGRIRHGNPVLCRDLEVEVMQHLPSEGEVLLVCAGELLAVGELRLESATGPGAIAIQPRTVLAME